jgi:hypothetical protein
MAANCRDYEKSAFQVPTPIADVEAVCECSRMETLTADTSKDRLYLKGLGIRYERRIGLWLPIMRRLALRGHTGAMIELADWFSSDNRAKTFGKPADAYSAAGLYLRACRKGDARAASNAAMSCFNRNDMAGYRRWLRQGVRIGDQEAALELGWFESRLWHSAARKVRRLRPKLMRDGFV